MSLMERVSEAQRHAKMVRGIDISELLEAGMGVYMCSTSKCKFVHLGKSFVH